MKYFLLLLVALPLYAEPEPLHDTKNVMALVGDIILLRSHSKANIFHSDINYRTSYIEAYDLRTGDLLWVHKDSGMFITFLIAEDQNKVIVRNYYKITALDIETGTVLWSKDTYGAFSTIVGE